MVSAPKTGKNRINAEGTGKKPDKEIREVLFQGTKLHGDCIMVFGKRSSCLHGSQWAADSAALPKEVLLSTSLLYPLMLTWPGVTGGETKI